MNRMLEYIGQYTNIDDSSWKFLQDRLKIINYKQGEIIQQSGKLCDRMGFILEGIARSYLQKVDGKDFTWYFHYYKNNASAKQVILIDYPNFTLQKPSIYSFQALTDCKVACISYHNVQAIMPRIHDSYLVEKHLFISAYGHSNERLKSLLTKSARERLKEFELNHGELFEKIPHYYIASFLGITPQRLSQLRNIKNVKGR